MIAAALACSFLGDDCLASTSSSLTTIANFLSFLEDWTDDSEEALFSDDTKLLTAGLISSDFFD